MPVPQNPSIYHITHLDNLAGIVQAGRLWSDAQRIRRGFGCTNIGYSHIKARRLRKPVNAAKGGFLGDYVPFYFCYRSVMLYKIWRTHEDYKGGQNEVVHLVSCLDQVTAAGRSWAFSTGNASADYVKEFFDSPVHLDKIDWDAMPLRQWSEHREQRQAEFLVHDWFPWECVQKVVAKTSPVAEAVLKIIEAADHKPAVATEPSWYY